jgi:hypothetical protein
MWRRLWEGKPKDTPKLDTGPITREESQQYYNTFANTLEQDENDKDPFRREIADLPDRQKWAEQQRLYKFYNLSDEDIQRYENEIGKSNPEELEEILKKKTGGKRRKSKRKTMRTKRKSMRRR